MAAVAAPNAVRQPGAAIAKRAGPHAALTRCYPRMLPYVAREMGQGKTVVLISHRFSSVRMADRIVVLVDGAVGAVGTHGDLLQQRGRYAELFELRAAGYR